MEQSKQSAIATLKSWQLYVDDKLNSAFIQKVYNEEKKLIPQNCLLAVEQKLVQHPFLNTEILYDEVTKMDQWVNYLPDKFEDTKVYIANLINSSSHMAFELVLQDVVQVCKDFAANLKNLDKAADDMEVDIDSLSNPHSQIQALRCLHHSKITKTLNGFKVSSKKTIKTKDAKTMLLERANASIVDWDPSCGSQTDLQELISALFPAKVHNKVSPQVMGVFTQRGGSSACKMRISVQISHTCLETPSGDPRLSKYLKKCTNRSFVEQMISTVKTKVARQVKHYTFSLTNPSLLSGIQVVQKPLIVSEPSQRILSVNVIRSEILAKQAVQVIANSALANGSGSGGQQQPDVLRVVAKDQTEYDAALDRRVYDCELCFLSPITRHFTLLSCGHVICENCFNNMLTKKCHNCKSFKIILRRGKPLTPQQLTTERARQAHGGVSADDSSQSSNQLFPHQFTLTDKEGLQRMSKYDKAFIVSEGAAVKDLLCENQKLLEENQNEGKNYAELEIAAQTYVEQIQASHQEELQRWKIEYENLQLALQAATSGRDGSIELNDSHQQNSEFQPVPPQVISSFGSVDQLHNFRDVTSTLTLKSVLDKQKLVKQFGEFEVKDKLLLESDDSDEQINTSSLPSTQQTCVEGSNPSEAVQFRI